MEARFWVLHLLLLGPVFDGAAFVDVGQPAKLNFAGAF